jgi:hypothetical protein
VEETERDYHTRRNLPDIGGGDAHFWAEEEENINIQSKFLRSMLSENDEADKVPADDPASVAGDRSGEGESNIEDYLTW